MTRRDYDLEQRLLESAERLWLDPDWDTVSGFPPSAPTLEEAAVPTAQ